MSDEHTGGERPASPQQQPPATSPAHPAPGEGAGFGMQPYGEAPPPGWSPTSSVGKVRGTGTCILLMIVTLGIYSWFWYYKVHDEMKTHTGRGIGGGIALILAIFVGIVLPYITSSEVGEMHEGRGQAKPVSAATGLWAFPGVLILIGPLVWFVKTNGALNNYWRSLGAR